MKRAAIERQRTIKTWKAHLYLAHRDELMAGAVRCVCDLQANRFRKGQKMLGCGRPKCSMCHYEKVFNIPKARDLRQLAKAEELE